MYSISVSKYGVTVYVLIAWISHTLISLLWKYWPIRKRYGCFDWFNKLLYVLRLLLDTQIRFEIFRSGAPL